MSPPLNRDDFARRLAVLRNAVADLRRYAAQVTPERLRADRDTQNMVLYALFVGAQAAVDIALQIASARRLANDGTYRGAFRALAGAGLIDAEDGLRLEGWASLRNVVAHFYPVIDLDKVWLALSVVSDLERLADWAESVASA